MQGPDAPATTCSRSTPDRIWWTEPRIPRRALWTFNAVLRRSVTVDRSRLQAFLAQRQLRRPLANTSLGHFRPSARTPDGFASSAGTNAARPHPAFDYELTVAA